MKFTTNTLILLFGIIVFAMVALISVVILSMPFSQPEQPVDYAATVQAMVTQTMIAMTQSAPTQTPPPPTATVVPATNTPVPTNTPLPTATTVSYCEWVTFVKDVTIPDGTKLLPGQTFTKTWRLRNRGTCAWTSDYMLVFTGGDPMGGTTAVRLPGTVAPGQSVDVSVTLTAPTTRGHHIGYWMLRNPSGVLFGFGESANKAFYVDIVTEDSPPGTVSGNFYYPSEFNPPLMLYFENAVTGDVIQFAIPDRNPSYSVLLPSGTYYAYAWATGYNLQGAYVYENLTMKPFTVKAGQVTSGINLTDWSPYPHSRGQ